MMIRSMFQLKRRSLAQKFVLLVTGIVLMTTSVTVVALVARNHRGSVEREATDLTESLEIGRVRVLAEIERVIDDVRMLASFPGVAELARIAHDGGSWEPGASQVGALIEPLLASRPWYLQARVIGGKDAGHELVRVDRSGKTTRVLGFEELQDKSDRNYVKRGAFVDHDLVYLSTLDLNREHGEVQVPHVLVLRAAIPLRSAEGTHVGIAVINLDMDRVFAALRNSFSSQQSICVLDQHGCFLYHPDESMRYGCQLGRAERLENWIPEASHYLHPGSDDTACFLHRDKTGALTDTGLVRARFDPSDSSRFIVLTLSESHGSLTDRAMGVAGEAVLIGVLCVITASLIGFFFARSITRPLEEVTKTIERFGGEAVALGLADEPRDEIDTLAITFEKMSEAVQARTEQFHQEIAKRAEKEEELRLRSEELDRTNRDLEQFVYAAAHDLRSPLKGIANLATWLMDDLPDNLPAETTDMALLIQKRAERLDHLVADLLHYASAGGTRQASHESIDLAVMVPEIVETLAIPAGFRVECEGPMPIIEGDPAVLRHAMMNLIQNAIRHHDRKEGVVVVRARTTPSGCAVEVSDDGPGIPQKYQEEVFKLFRTLRPRDEVEGSGMGLTIARRFVENSGGTITLRSEGRGACFTIKWPGRTLV